MGHEKITGSDCYDSLQIRCPRLGGEVTFAYCRVEGDDIPCIRIIICWQNCLPIAGFLQERLSADQLERFAQQKPKERIVTLVELIEAAKKECRD
jgi:hypothetical protein